MYESCKVINLQETGRCAWMVYVIMAVIIWAGTYANMALSKQPIEVKPVKSMDDLFE